MLRGCPHTHSAPASLILFFWGVLPFFGGVRRTLEKEEKKGGVSRCCWTGRGARQVGWGCGRCGVGRCGVGASAVGRGEDLFC